jgi:alanine racemase
MTNDLALRPSWIELDLDALEANYREAKRRAGAGVHVIASIKADGYGHGAAEVARRLEGLGAWGFATGSIRDARALRAAGVTKPILMFGGALPEAIPQLVAEGFIPTVYDEATLRAASGAVWVKVDSGLGRLGVRLDRAEGFILEAAGRPGVTVQGVYTHLAFSDEAGAAWARERLPLFEALIASLKSRGLEIPMTQARASPHLECGMTDALNAVNPGHLLYGMATTNGYGDAAALRPVLRAVKSRLIHVQRWPQGWSLGSGGKRRLAPGAITGVMPMGLNEGYRNAAAGETAQVVVRGRRAPVLSVSLEHCTLDLSGVPDAAVGDEVCALGEGIALHEVARWLSQPAGVVLMNFDGRLPAVAKD